MKNIAVYEGATVKVDDSWVLEGSFDDEDEKFYGRFDTVGSDEAVAFIVVNRYGWIESFKDSNENNLLK